MSINMAQLLLGDIKADVVKKNIKNLHLRVTPPTGKVMISAPLRMKLETIRGFALSKLGWIKKQQARFRNQVIELPKEFLDSECHYFGGKQYFLKVEEINKVPRVNLNDSTIELRVRPNTSSKKREQLVDDWYRAKLKEILPNLFAKWESKMGVKVAEFGIKKMKTKWGTCNIRARRIWINLELAKRPAECLEYVVVHEVAHLLERGHGPRFKALMDKHLPNWRLLKQELNQHPIIHPNWN